MEQKNNLLKRIEKIKNDWGGQINQAKEELKEKTIKEIVDYKIAISEAKGEEKRDELKQRLTKEMTEAIAAKTPIGKQIDEILKKLELSEQIKDELNDVNKRYNSARENIKKQTSEILNNA